MIFAQKIEEQLKQAAESIENVLHEYASIGWCSVSFHCEIELSLSENIKKEELMLIIEGNFTDHCYEDLDEVVVYYFDIDDTTLANLESLTGFLVAFFTENLKSYRDSYEKNHPESNEMIERVLFNEIYNHYHKTFHLEYINMDVR